MAKSRFRGGAVIAVFRRAGSPGGLGGGGAGEGREADLAGAAQMQVVGGTLPLRISESISVTEGARYVVGVKLVVQVKLLPEEAARAALRETLHACNRAADHASRRAFETGIKGGRSLQRLVYADLKAMGLSAQPALHVVRKAAGAYAALEANLKAGNHGREGSKRRKAVESKPVHFRKDVAQPFDDRCLSWQLEARTAPAEPAW